MSRSYDNEKKPSQSTFSFKPTASFLQTRPFAPVQTDLDEDATPRPSGYTENFLEKIINQRGTESSDTPVQAKPMNRLKRPLQDKRVSIIQAKLSIGEPNDKYEQEADATASKVVQQINSPNQDKSVQREAMEEEEELRMKPISSIQREAMEEEDEELQMKPISTIQRKEKSDESRPNETGLPNELKAGVENLSGYSLDDVRVHYNSPKPAQLQALAYAQGTDIHIAHGQEEHLPHEAWHVVQQMQGRVQPTMQMQGLQVNDDESLEKEADVNGSKAAQLSAHDDLLQGKFEMFQRHGIEEETLQGKFNIGALQLKSTIIQMQPKPNVTGASKDSVTLKNLVNALFKGAPSGGATIGDGSALAACAHEKNGGAKVGGADHQEKCRQVLKGVVNLINRASNPDVIRAGSQLSEEDLEVATKLEGDLEDALEGTYVG
jgi:hypothetical protein